MAERGLEKGALSKSKGNEEQGGGRSREREKGGIRDRQLEGERVKRG